MARLSAAFPSAAAAAAVAATAAAAVVGVAVAQLPTCPPPGFDSLRGFNVSKYADLDYGWYAQEQMEIAYLPLEWNYCVKTTYNQLQQDLGRPASAHGRGVRGERASAREAEAQRTRESEAT